ncbi:hypothetical protein D3C80_1714990 [compost metagenome]
MRSSTLALKNSRFALFLAAVLAMAFVRFVTDAIWQQANMLRSVKQSVLLRHSRSVSQELSLLCVRSIPAVLPVMILRKVCRVSRSCSRRVIRKVKRLFPSLTVLSRKSVRRRTVVKSRFKEKRNPRYMQLPMDRVFA